MADSKVWAARGVSAFGLVGLIVTACSSGAPSVAVGTEAVSEDGILVCSAADSASSEWYSVRAMVNKAKHYPDFAATTKQEAISSCAAARDFYDRYSDYSTRHPGFDSDEPLEDDQLPEPSLPADVDPDVRGSHDTNAKILNGTGDQLSPVVGIRNAIGNCTGTFIGRNWILTAAHCLAYAPGYDLKLSTPAKEPSAKVHAWYPYKVSFAGPNGVVPGDVRLYNLVLQYADPRYVGFRDPVSLRRVYGGAHDTALLYVNDAYDNRLPNNDPGLNTSTAPLMRVSLRDTAPPSATAWGFGNPDQSALQRGGLQAYHLTAETNGFDMFEAALIGSGTSTDVTLCTGDSGGPLTDRYNTVDPLTGNPVTQFVTVGTLHGFTNPLVDAQGNLISNCAQTDSVIFWPRTSKEAGFITRTIAKWYPSFPCVTGRIAGSTTDDYLECWGKPCKDNSACLSNQTCVHPGSLLNSCTGCGTGSSNCDCIFGQCLPTN